MAKFQKDKVLILNLNGERKFKRLPSIINDVFPLPEDHAMACTYSSESRLGIGFHWVLVHIHANGENEYGQPRAPFGFLVHESQLMMAE